MRYFDALFRGAFVQTDPLQGRLKKSARGFPRAPLARVVFFGGEWGYGLVPPPSAGSSVQPSSVQSIWPFPWQSPHAPSMPYAASFGAIS